MPIPLFPLPYDKDLPESFYCVSSTAENTISQHRILVLAEHFCHPDDYEAMASFFTLLLDRGFLVYVIQGNTLVQLHTSEAMRWSSFWSQITVWDAISIYTAVSRMAPGLDLEAIIHRTQILEGLRLKQWVEQYTGHLCRFPTRQELDADPEKVNLLVRNPVVETSEQDWVEISALAPLYYRKRHVQGTKDISELRALGMKKLTQLKLSRCRVEGLALLKYLPELECLTWRQGVELFLPPLNGVYPVGLHALCLQRSRVDFSLRNSLLEQIRILRLEEMDVVDFSNGPSFYYRSVQELHVRGGIYNQNKYFKLDWLIQMFPELKVLELEDVDVSKLELSAFQSWPAKIRHLKLTRCSHFKPEVLEQLICRQANLRSLMIDGISLKEIRHMELLPASLVTVKLANTGTDFLFSQTLDVRKSQSALRYFYYSGWLSLNTAILPEQLQSFSGRVPHLIRLLDEPAFIISVYQPGMPYALQKHFPRLRAAKLAFTTNGSEPRQPAANEYALDSVSCNETIQEATVEMGSSGMPLKIFIRQLKLFKNLHAVKIVGVPLKMEGDIDAIQDDMASVEVLTWVLPAEPVDVAKFLACFKNTSYLSIDASAREYPFVFAELPFLPRLKELHVIHAADAVENAVLKQKCPHLLAYRGEPITTRLKVQALPLDHPRVTDAQQAINVSASGFVFPLFVAALSVVIALALSIAEFEKGIFTHEATWKSSVVVGVTAFFVTGVMAAGFLPLCCYSSAEKDGTEAEDPRIT